MIETSRLTLRPWRDDDRDWYAASCACPIVMEHLGGPKTRAECDLRVDRMMAAATAGEPGFWLVERRADGARLGDAGLKRVDAPDAPIPGEIEIGWRLAREHRGQGYAREAAIAALDHAFGHLAALRVVALASRRNVASLGLMRRLGMTRHPALDFADPRHAAIDQPTIVHAIKAAEWPAPR